MHILLGTRSFAAVLIATQDRVPSIFIGAQFGELTLRRNYAVTRANHRQAEFSLTSGPISGLTNRRSDIDGLADRQSHKEHLVRADFVILSLLTLR